MNTNLHAKRILLYGDSLVFGKASGENKRLDSNTRFSGVLQDLLGEDYEVIEEGLRARMIKGENGFFPNRDGAQQFNPIIGSHLPLDLVIIILGTNDCNIKARKSATEIASSFVQYAAVIDEWVQFLEVPKPGLLVVAPPSINEPYYDEGAKAIFGDGASDKAAGLPIAYQQIAEQIGAGYIDLQTVCNPAEGDGIHLDAEGNRQVAEALHKKIKEIL